MITDDERRAMRARADAADRGPWRAGTVEHEAKVWAHDPDALGALVAGCALAPRATGAVVVVGAALALRWVLRMPAVTP